MPWSLQAQYLLWCGLLGFSEACRADLPECQLRFHGDLGFEQHLQDIWSLYWRLHILPQGPSHQRPRHDQDGKIVSSLLLSSLAP